MQSVIVFAACVAILILLWVMLYDTAHFVTTQYRVEDPRIKKPCRAVVIADLHNKYYGRENEVLLAKIREEKPDLVLVVGDILTAKPGADPEPALKLIRELAKDFFVCYGNGNHEHRIKLYPETYGSLAQEYEEGLKACGVSALVNARQGFAESGLSVVGVEIHKEYYMRFRGPDMEDDYLRTLLGEPDKEFYTVLLAHNPDYFPAYAKWGADLVLSGHTHGGVARIPFWNRGVLSPALRLFPKYDGGVFSEGGSTMILSRGLGSHTVPVRLFNPGDLIFLEFCSGKESLVTKKER